VDEVGSHPTVTDFAFATSPEARAYCERILDEMVRLFGIPKSEALDRMNKLWANRPITSDMSVSLLTHELPEYWAKRLYYSPDVYWWRAEKHGDDSNQQ
jgi:hypothetical protein